MTMTVMPSILLMRAISFCSGVGSSTVASSISAIAPTSVSMPVAGDDRAADALDDGGALVDHVRAGRRAAPAPRSVAGPS